MSEVGRRFLDSAEAEPPRAQVADPAAFLAERARAYDYVVREVPLSALPRWQLGATLRHDTGRFFTVEGVAVETSFGPTPRWTQPILVQPEIGMLGFLVKRIAGTLHFLVQAKMEPGNRTMVQLAPTVQATPSNYLRVHAGRSTPYLEHFVAPTRGRVLVDQLQSEQGSRYLRKRNRNMIVELPPDHEVAVEPDFAWLTLRQIRELLVAGNTFNLNARTVLSCIAYAGTAPAAVDGWRAAVLASHLAAVADDDVRGALSWLTDIKSALTLDVRRIPLDALEQWVCNGESIRHASGRFFRVLGVSIEAASREVPVWAQPMIEPTRDGVLAFLCQRRDGVLQFLVQARAEPGFIDTAELGATLQLSPGNYDPDKLPPLAEYLDAPADHVRLRMLQSEDGGRFYRDEKLHLVIELPEGERVDAPPSYRWMTLALLKRVMACGYHVTVEARSLIACLA